MRNRKKLIIIMFALVFVITLLIVYKKIIKHDYTVDPTPAVVGENTDLTSK